MDSHCARDGGKENFEGFYPRNSIYISPEVSHVTSVHSSLPKLVMWATPDYKKTRGDNTIIFGQWSGSTVWQLVVTVDLTRYSGI